MPNRKLKPLFSTKHPEIKKLLGINYELSDVGSALALLHWDQEVYMPKGAAGARANQLSTLAGFLHKLSTSKKIGRLIDSLETQMKGGEFTVHDRALVREFRRDYDRSTKVPKELVKAFTKAVAQGIEAWQRARQESKFSLFRDALARIIDLKLERANYIGYKDTPYNLFLDDHEPGLTVKEVDRVFSSLRDITIEALRVINESNVHIDQDVLRKSLPSSGLGNFTVEILKAMGFDFERGRQDTSVHPFTILFDPTDVRVTTRFGEQFFTSSIHSSIHEGGHALYSQGIDPRLSRTILGGGASLGIHESQSRFWENCVGRSFAFWRNWYPKLMRAFPKHGFEAAHEEDFVRAINKVEPNLIRVDSDEITYNLHIILRYEIERDLIDGKLHVDDLPEAWNTKFKKYLGLDVPDDARGVLQDVHWSHGSFGYFPTYSLGNLYAAQLFYTVRKVFPDFYERIAKGEMMFLREWFKENIHRHGDTYSAHELITKITGEDLNPEYFRNYLREKFGEIYHF